MSVLHESMGRYGQQVLTGASTVTDGPFAGIAVTGGASVTVTTTGPTDDLSSVAISDGTTLPIRCETVQFVSGTGVLIAYYSDVASGRN